MSHRKLEWHIKILLAVIEVYYHQCVLYPQENKCLPKSTTFAQAEVRNEAINGNLQNILSFCKYSP